MRVSRALPAWQDAGSHQNQNTGSASSARVWRSESRCSVKSKRQHVKSRRVWGLQHNSSNHSVAIDVLSVALTVCGIQALINPLRLVSAEAGGSREGLTIEISKLHSNDFSSSTRSSAQDCNIRWRERTELRYSPFCSEQCRSLQDS